MGFVGTKPTISSNVVISDGGTIGSASDEDAIAIAADGSVTFTQDIELGHASDTTIARSGSGDITIEGNAVYRAGGTDVPVADGGTGQSTLNNLITMGSHTTGNYVASITAGTGLTSDGATSGESIAHSLSVDASQTQITAVGTIATGVWQGTAIASAYLDSDTAHLSGTQTFSGAKTFTSTITVGVDDTGQDVKFFGATSGKYMEWDESADQLDVTGSFDVTGNSSMVGTLTVGVDDTGHDVKFFGATSGKYMEWDESADQLDVTASLDVTGNTSMVGTLTIGVNDTRHDVKFFGASSGAYMEWDESADQLRIMGASADATTSTGKLLLATSLTDINANDVLGKIEFQAPHEADGTDAITVAAGIEAVAQGTFSASVNATDLVFKTGHSEAATEKFRFTSQGEIGIGGANYGSDGQVLTSTGAGTAPAWEDAGGGGVEFTATANGAISAGDLVAIRADGDIEKAQGIQEGKAWAGFASNSGTTVDANDDGYYSSIGFDPDNNKFIVAYRDADNSNYPTMAMGHISDAAAHTMSFGTPVVLSSGGTGYNVITGANIPYDTSVDRFVVPYQTGDGKIYAKVCTVNDAASNTITAGSQQTLEDSSDRAFSIVFDSNANRMVMVFEDEGDSNHFNAVAFTVRGSSDNDIQSIGSVAAVTDADDADTIVLGMCFDSNDNKVMFVYGDASNSRRPTAVALTVDNSDNSLTVGTAVVLNTVTLNAGYHGSLVHHAAKNINLFVTRNSGGTNLLYMPFTSSSGTITAGTMFTETAVAALGHELGSPTFANYNPDFERIVVFNSYSGMIVQTGDISGTGSSATYTVDDTIAYVPKNGETNGGYITYMSAAYDTNSNKHAIFYFANTAEKAMYATLPTVPYNCGKFIGIANSAISNDATGTVTSGGIGTNQSSLTVGSQYYIDSGGALVTTSGGTPVGRALSATTILVNAPVKQ